MKTQCKCVLQNHLCGKLGLVQDLLKSVQNATQYCLLKDQLGGQLFIDSSPPLVEGYPSLFVLLYLLSRLLLAFLILEKPWSR